MLMLMLMSSIPRNPQKWQWIPRQWVAAKTLWSKQKTLNVHKWRELTSAERGEEDEEEEKKEEEEEEEGGEEEEYFRWNVTRLRPLLPYASMVRLERRSFVLWNLRGEEEEEEKEEKDEEDEPFHPLPLEALVNYSPLIA